MTEDALVYTDPDGKHYVGLFGEDGCWRWPAQEHGWEARQCCSETLAESCVEYDSFQARLALRLSGALDR